MPRLDNLQFQLFMISSLIYKELEVSTEKWIYCEKDENLKSQQKRKMRLF